MNRLLLIGAILIWLGLFIPFAVITAQSDPVYVGCTPVPTFSPSLWANCLTATPSSVRSDTPRPTSTTIRLPTATTTLTPFPASITTQLTQIDPRRTQETLELDPIFQVATQYAEDVLAIPGYNASTAMARTAIPTQESFATTVIGRPTPSPTLSGSTPYVVTALQGSNVRGDCRSTSTSCPPVGKINHGSVIWVTETYLPNTPNTTLDDYLWGKIGAGQWVALRCANNTCNMVRDGSR